MKLNYYIILATYLLGSIFGFLSFYFAFDLYDLPYSGMCLVLAYVCLVLAYVCLYVGHWLEGKK